MRRIDLMHVGAFFSLSILQCTVSAVESASLVDGYENVQWGKSMEDVKKIVGGPDWASAPAWGTNVLEEGTAEFSVKGSFPIEFVHYLFRANQLCGVDVVLEEEFSRGIGGLSSIEGLLREKYGEHEEVKQLLTKEKISVIVNPYRGSRRKPPHDYYDTVAISYRHNGLWRKLEPLRRKLDCLARDAYHARHPTPTEQDLVAKEQARRKMHELHNHALEVYHARRPTPTKQDLVAKEQAFRKRQELIELSRIQGIL